MADYREMYYILCAAAAKAIDAPAEDVNELLQGALYEAEEIYIRTCEEERLKTMSVKQLLETNHVLQDSLAKQLDDLQDRYASLYISNDMKRQDIYKMVDKLCQTAPLDHIYVALRQLLFKAQERA